MFGSLAPGMPKVAKPKRPRKFKAPSAAYRGVTQQPMPPAGNDVIAAPAPAAAASEDAE